jgi:predicted aldo/keto reductase-like oxidoreductase
MSNIEQQQVRNTSGVRSIFHKALWLMLYSCARIRAKGEENMAHKMKRREFIGKATIGMMAAGLPAPFAKKAVAGQEQPPKILYRTLGRTGLRISIVSFGVMNSDSPDLIQRALDMGINHLDTAHVYLRGNSERVIGEVLERSGNRDEVFVATKMAFNRDEDKGVFVQNGNEGIPGASEDNLVKQLETSLERLRTDYVDILYLHSCVSPQMVTYEPLMNALVKVKKQGKARFLGTSVHTDVPNIIRATTDAEIYDVVLAAYNYVQEEKEEIKKAIAYAAGKGVGIVAMKTQGGARLQQDSEAKINNQAALKWVLNDENVSTTVPGMTTFEQLDMNMGVMNDLALTEKEMGDLEYAASLRGTLFCQSCRSCVPTCPNSVAVPNLMRAYMYAAGYGNYIQARATVAELPGNKGLSVCRECSACSAVCRRGIDIASRIDSLIANGLHAG